MDRLPLPQAERKSCDPAVAEAIRLLMTSVGFVTQAGLLAANRANGARPTDLPAADRLPRWGTRTHITHSVESQSGATDQELGIKEDAMARTQGHGNPKWIREEVILALALYTDCGGQVPGPHDPRVIALSKQLQALQFHNRSQRRATFRNPDGVAFKLQNLRQLATGDGLQHVSRTDRAVWNEFKDRAAELRRAARKILSMS